MWFTTFLYILCSIGCVKKLKKQTYTTPMFYKKNGVKIYLQPIPSHKFVIYVLTKQSKKFNQFNLRHFCISYVVLDVIKNLKIRHMLLVCFIKNGVKIYLQPIPSQKLIFDVGTKQCKKFNQFNQRIFLKSYVVSDVS